MTLEFSATDYLSGKQDISAKPYKVLPWTKIKNIKSSPVNLLKLSKDEYRKIGERLLATCLTEQGVGLAAPQVGIFKRMFMVEQIDENTTSNPRSNFTLYLNPVWVPETNEQSTEVEGCLSVPNKGYAIRRYNTIKVTYDIFPKEISDPTSESKVLTGLMARIFQHEYSHLNGISIPQLWKLQNKK